jgi:hypothetical protein
MLAIDPRPGNATSNCAADNITLLDLAVSRLPARYRRRMLIRLDGAGFSHQLLQHITTGAGVKGRGWEFSVDWSCTDTEINAIEQLLRDAWTPGIDQNGDLVEDTFVADLTGLLDLRTWHTKIPDLRIIVRDEPLHPRYRKRATDPETTRPPLPTDRGQREGRVAGLARRAAPLACPRGKRRQPGQGPRPGPVAVPALGDQRRVDPDRRHGREPVGLLPPAGPARRAVA